MDYTKLEHHLSQPRLYRYFVACKGSETEAQKLYNVNLGVSKGFYPIMSMFEIIFRNACHNQLSAMFKNPDWIIVEKSGFMSSPSLERTKYFLRESVLSAEKSILKSKNVVSAEKIVGELVFGFWTSLLAPHHFSLVKGSILQAFPGKPAGVNRAALSAKLTRVREFRNRIYHNEPICFNGEKIDFSHAVDIRRDIYELLEWIDPELPEYVGSFDTVNDDINYFTSQ